MHQNPPHMSAGNSTLVPSARAVWPFYQRAINPSPCHMFNQSLKSSHSFSEISLEFLLCSFCSAWFTLMSDIQTSISLGNAGSILQMTCLSLFSSLENYNDKNDAYNIFSALHCLYNSFPMYYFGEKYCLEYFPQKSEIRTLDK